MPRTRQPKGSLASRTRAPKVPLHTPEQLRQLALQRRAHADGQRSMRKALHRALKDLLYDDETTVEDILDVVLTMPLAPPPAWTQPQEKRQRRG